MWPFKKKTRQRRVEVRKAPAPGASAWRRFRLAGGVSALLVGVIFLAGVAALDLYPLEPVPYRMGQYIAADIYPRTTFSMRQNEEYQRELTQAQQNAPATYRLTDASKRIEQEILAAVSGLQAATQPADVAAELRQRFDIQTPEALADWQRYGTEEGLRTLKPALTAFGQALTTLPIVRKEAVARERERRGVEDVLLLHDEARTRRFITDLIDVTSEQDVRRRIGTAIRELPSPIRKGVDAYLMNFLVAQAQPLYVLDEDAWAALKAQRVARVRDNPPMKVYEPGSAEPMVYRSIRPATTGEGWQKRGLTEQDMEVLKKEHEEWLKAQNHQRPFRAFMLVSGRLAILALIVALLGLYVAKYEPLVFRAPAKAAALTALLLVMLAINKVAIHLPESPYSAVLPVLLGAIVVAVAYNQRFAMTVGSVLALLVTLQMRSDLGMLLVLLTTVMAGVFQLHEVRTRSKLLLTGAVVALGVTMMVAATSLARGIPPYPFILWDALWAAGFALLAGLLAQAMLPGVEKAFRVATSMTLLEWCDASKPLLKRLAMEAPGTYNHSLLLGTMCEAAADAIGARGLLARVGAYYHDIGKINKPQYFVENQGPGPSKHAKLSPAMSLLIIIGHVKDGLEMAREYGLPQVLREFIASHHGTTLVQYFYHAATEQRKSDMDRAPDEVEFRYPGPKPQAKEVAILMLADAAESSVRAMTEPTPGRIENQVHSVVSRRLMDGQLDQCDLTLREVHLIESSLVKSLCGIYHGRIAYPTPAGQKPSAAETPGPRQQQAAAEKEKNGNANGQGNDQSPNGQGNGQGNGQRPNGESPSEQSPGTTN